MNLNNLNEEAVEFILKGLEILTKTGEFDMEDVLKIAALHQFIDKAATEILDKANNEEVPETLARNPNKNERFVYGKSEYVKDK
jgi:hypothetical protein